MSQPWLEADRPVEGDVVREHEVPALVAATPRGSLADLPPSNAARNPGNIAFARRSGSGWADVTAAQFNDEVGALAKGFRSAGVQTGDRVAVMSKTRYEWTLVDFALWTAGAVVVPVYETSSADQVLWILQDSGAVGVVVESATHQAAVEQIRGELPALAHVWQIDAGGLDELVGAGSSVSDEDLAASRAGVERASIATIIYTSGTTGRPKGCELTHENFMGLAENAIGRLGEVVQREGASTLLFLPLAHVFARFIEVLCVAAEARMGHSADLKNLLDDLASFKPTFILAVPRVFEKIYNSAEARAAGGGKDKIFAMATDTAIAWSTALDAGRPGIALKARHAVFDRLVYVRLRDAMGGQVAYAVSGGAPLGTRLGHFFRGMGVTVLEGYGLTETSAPATVNTPELVKIGTVGPPLPGVSIRIGEDGEILTKGVNLFHGYHNNEQATRDAVQDGWFHTGDIGELDDDGFLRITGRKKEILVTAGGKNVAPAALEDRLRAHPLISQCIVVGDQKPFIGALVTLDAEMVPSWAKNRGLGALTAEQARGDAAVSEAIQRAVDDANTAVSKAESIRKFRILEGDLTEESGHLTPSLKLKRNVVMKDYSAEVDALYGS